MTETGGNSRSFFDRYTVEIVFTVLYLLLSIVLNLQFLQGSNINTIIAGHDEYIAVREVYSILHPISWKHFFLSIIAGDVIFYGRIMFYIDAVFAYIPFKIWGITGMVYSIRMVHALFLISALLILANIFLREKFHKALFFMGTGAVFYSLYFVMMPKPEPMQLFFLAIFFYFFKKTNWSFGPHFILLGIAFGLKINVLVLLPILFILPFFKKGLRGFKKQVLQALKSIAYFFTGLIIAIPCLALSPLKPIYLNTYIHETFLGTGKAYDNLSLSFFDWLKGGFGGYYLGYWGMGYVFMLFVLVALMIQMRKATRYTADISALLLLSSGLILTMVIMLTTKRLWPHYIWTGFIFMYLGLMVFVSHQTSLKYRRVYLSVVSLMMLISLAAFFTRDLPMYMTLEKDLEVIDAYQESHFAIEYVRHKYPSANVATDPSLLYLFSDFVKAKPYHPFSSGLPESGQGTFTWYGDHPEQIWEEKNDIVVFYKNHPLKQKSSDGSLAKLFNEQISANFIVDTTFGDVSVYRRTER